VNKDKKGKKKKLGGNAGGKLVGRGGGKSVQGRETKHEQSTGKKTVPEREGEGKKKKRRKNGPRTYDILTGA